MRGRRALAPDKCYATRTTVRLRLLRWAVARRASNDLIDPQDLTPGEPKQIRQDVRPQKVASAGRMDGIKPGTILA